MEQRTRPQKDEVERAISAVPWEDYETAYGSAAGVGDSLRALFSEDREAALQASHDLWCGLCHQHAFLSSAALPAFDILFCGLEELDEPLKVELLDIFYGFAACTARDREQEWQRQLREKLLEKRPCFQALVSHPNEDISSFGELILENL